MRYIARSIFRCALVCAEIFFEAGTQQSMNNPNVKQEYVLSGFDSKTVQ